MAQGGIGEKIENRRRDERQKSRILDNEPIQCPPTLNLELSTPEHSYSQTLPFSNSKQLRNNIAHNPLYFAV